MVVVIGTFFTKLMRRWPGKIGVVAYDNIRSDDVRHS
jgi:hypothetical protein